MVCADEPTGYGQIVLETGKSMRERERERERENSNNVLSILFLHLVYTCVETKARFIQ